ncbi:MAG: hypothetical protein J2O46_02215 [Nocardioides sp.]|nr:hypothetical protein [Nocardioides sp.]
MSLLHILGTDGHEWYNFWSGMGADLGELVFVGGAVAMYRKHECHVKGCHRLGRQKINGKEWVVCHKHHPDGHATVEKINEHVRSQAGVADRDRTVPSDR